MRLLLFSSFMMLLSTLDAQPGKTAATDFLGVSGPIKIYGSTYSLAWSSHPSPQYYKQEYLKAGEKLEKFGSMVMVEVLTGVPDHKQIVAAKLKELDQMKANNPIVNYETFENKQAGEFMIDFLLSANEADGSIQILERNVYRYKSIIDKQGKKAVLLFAVSVRSYGKQATIFLAELKGKRSALIDQVAQFKLPAPAI
ncbi:MAG: hypothetical protein H7Y31_01770 [Chitinophagaceae bacterium]|nr:hypothetical protein [Chitinophagaceae bacterium]